MKLSEMRQLLATHDVQLTKSLGQNFLHDANQLRRIAALADLSERDRLLEIGPGLGPLTELLVNSGATVLAIEKDRRLIDILKARFMQRPNFELIAADALDYLRTASCDWAAWKVVSNLPYSVASSIIVELAQNPTRPAMLVVTLQLEVVQRLLAKPDSADYGLLTVLVQAWYQPDGHFTIPPTCFFPEPDVDSACIKLTRRATPLLRDSSAPTFTRVVKRAFSQRRKMMFKLLKADWDEELLKTAYERLHLEPTARAEALSPEQLAQLAKFLHDSYK